MASVSVWFLIVSSATSTPGMVGPLESQAECEKLITQYRDAGVFCKHAIERRECPPVPDGKVCPVWIFEKPDAGKK